MSIDDARQRKNQKVQNNRLHRKSKHQSMQMSQITNNIKFHRIINRLRETTSTMASISEKRPHK